MKILNTKKCYDDDGNHVSYSCNKGMVSVPVKAYLKQSNYIAVALKEYIDEGGEVIDPKEEE